MEEANLISVIMGIYNCENTLEDAVNCIINQTYSNWELIMCDDGSDDLTYSLAKNIQEENPTRIVLLRNDKNKGLNYTLNKCLAFAKGEFIARMDADDLCDPKRFEIELDALLSEKDISIVSTDMEFFDEHGTWGSIAHPDYPEPRDLVFGPPFCHAPCMVRKEAYMSVGGYTEDKRLLRVEDYHLWMKMYSAGYIGKNIHKPLYKMRDDQNAIKRRTFKNYCHASYVKYLVVKELKLPKWMYIYILKPLLIAMIPKFFYSILHKKRLAKKN